MCRSGVLAIYLRGSRPLEQPAARSVTIEATADVNGDSRGAELGDVTVPSE